jgi:hypothetical protein
MGPAIRAAREQVAQERLLAAAETLAGRFDLQAQHEALAAARIGIRDPLLAATEPTAALPPADERLADLTAAEVGVRIDTMDAATLDRLAELEAAGRQRKTVLAAIDKRREQLAAGMAAEAGV